ncbi:MAG TPA: transposase [Cyclobacteriaceae bacterium]
MTELFNNKYRISSARLQKCNYANAGMYFITICTANRHCYFGHCNDAIMQLFEIGKIAETEWIKSIELRPDMNLELGEFVVMPNHFHGIIMIGDNEYNNDLDGRGDGRDAMHRVSTTNNPPNKFAPQSKNLASIIRGFKSAVTMYARKNHIEFAWQPRFHDHVIRSPDEFERISEYIRNNPAKWNGDRFYRKMIDG